MLLVLDYTGMGLRLSVVSRGRVGVAGGINAAILGLGVNNLLPAKAGEFAKTLYLRQECGVSVGTSLGFVFWERFADLNLLLFLAVGAVWASGLDLAAGPLALAACCLWAGVALAVLAPSLADRLAGLLYFQPLKDMTRDVAGQLRDGASPGLLLRVALVSLGVWVLYFLQFYVLVRFAANLPLTPAQALAAFLMAAGALAVPSTPGGVGVYEAVVVAALGLYHVPGERALAVALVYHAMLYLPSTGYALWLLARRGLSLKDLRPGGGGPS